MVCAWSMGWMLVVSGILVGKAQAAKPNVVFLLTDDQRPDTIAAFGNAKIHTPTLDSLVKAGVSFPRAVCAYPLCYPSRAEILTGCIGFRTGVFPDYSNRLADNIPLWPEVMREAGYHTWYVGKWHTTGKPTTRGYESSLGLYMGGGGQWWKDHNDAWGHAVTGYRGWVFQTDDGKLFPEKGVGLTPDISSHFADAAIELIRRKTPEPFFLHVNFTAPHDPLFYPSGYEKKYPPADMEVPKNFLPTHPFDHGNQGGRDENLWPTPRTEQDVRNELSVYYALISHLDTQVGRIVAALKETSQWENTILIFASDHGLAIGSHGLRGKQNMYEHTINVPLIICGPGIPQNVRHPAQVYLRDLYPTVCEMSQIATSKTMDGRSLVGLWTGKTQAIHPYIFGYFRDSQRMVRGDRWKLIHYPQQQKYQLFDLFNDPLEMKDRAADADAKPELEKLRQVLLTWQQQVGDPLLKP